MVGYYQNQLPTEMNVLLRAHRRFSKIFTSVRAIIVYQNQQKETIQIFIFLSRRSELQIIIIKISLARTCHYQTLKSVKKHGKMNISASIDSKKLTKVEVIFVMELKSHKLFVFQGRHFFKEVE